MDVATFELPLVLESGFWNLSVTGWDHVGLLGQEVTIFTPQGGVKLLAKTS